MPHLKQTETIFWFFYGLHTFRYYWAFNFFLTITVWTPGVLKMCPNKISFRKRAACIDNNRKFNNANLNHVSDCNNYCLKNLWHRSGLGLKRFWLKYSRGPIGIYICRPYQYRSSFSPFADLKGDFIREISLFLKNYMHTLHRFMKCQKFSFLAVMRQKLHAWITAFLFCTP